MSLLAMMRYAASLSYETPRPYKGHSTYVFEFAFDLPGHGGYLKAVHTGDMPFLWRNFSEGDLGQWPSFDGIDRSEVKSTSDKMGKMYASFIRNGDPGASWQAFDEEDQTVLWFGKQVETRPHLLKSEWDTFTSLGPNNVAALEKILVSNVRHEFTQEGEKNHA